MFLVPDDMNRQLKKTTQSCDVSSQFLTATQQALSLRTCKKSQSRRVLDGQTAPYSQRNGDAQGCPPATLNNESSKAYPEHRMKQKNQFYLPISNNFSPKVGQLPANTRMHPCRDLKRRGPSNEVVSVSPCSPDICLVPKGINKVLLLPLLSIGSRTLSKFPLTQRAQLIESGHFHLHEGRTAAFFLITVSHLMQRSQFKFSHLDSFSSRPPL